jgi:hypothetical protein
MAWHFCTQKVCRATCWTLAWLWLQWCFVLRLPLQQLPCVLSISSWTTRICFFINVVLLPLALLPLLQVYCMAT